MRKTYGVPMTACLGLNVDRAQLARAIRQTAMNLAEQWPLQFHSSMDQLQWCCVQLGLQLVMDIQTRTLFFEEINAR